MAGLGWQQRLCYATFRSRLQQVRIFANLRVLAVLNPSRLVVRGGGKEGDVAIEATEKIWTRREALSAEGRTAMAVALGALFVAMLASTWLFHKFDWDILEVVFLPLIHGQPVESDPYSFLLSSLLALLGEAVGGLPGFWIWLVLATALYVAAGVLIFLVAHRWTGSRAAATIGAAVFLSAYCIVYVSSYLDDNVFQAFFVCLALWALLRDRPRIGLAAVAYGLSCAFHLQSFALAPAFAVGVWLHSPGSAADRTRTLAVAAGLVTLVYGGLLLLFVDVGALIAVINGAASHGPGAFVVSQDDAGLLELLARGAVATLLPFPIHIRAIFERPLLYVPTLGAGLLYIGAVVALAVRRPGQLVRAAPWLATAFAGFAMGVLFALVAEPDGTERWVSVAPFFALLAAAAADRSRRFGSWTERRAGSGIIHILAAVLVLFAVFPGKVVAFAAFGSERQVVTSGMIAALDAAFAETDLVVLNEGFEALSLYRAQRTCYTVFEYWKDNVKCWGPEGVTHRDRDDPSYLDGQRTIAMQVGLPDLDADAVVDGEPVEICDPGYFARAFGSGRCVTLKVGRIR